MHARSEQRFPLCSVVTLLLMVLVAVLGGCKGVPGAGSAAVTTLRIGSPDGERQSPDLTVEVMSTNESRQRGLMFRKELAENHGMLFIFPDARDQGFWMKNTFLPLDMIFVSSDLKVVGILEDVPPLTEDIRSVGVPSMYVLEFSAGTAKRMGWSVGSTVTPVGPLPRAID